MWLTDIHLNFLSFEARMGFYQEIIDADINAIMLSGDISEGPSVFDHLKEMVAHIQKPIYFVLGNHDYYHQKIESARQELHVLTQKETLLYWLPASGAQDLGNSTLLLGVDTWADGRYGEYNNSALLRNDSRSIIDFVQSIQSNECSLLEKMQEFSDQDAVYLKRTLLDTIKNAQPKKIIILTHIPPFQEVCLHKGKRINDNFLPFYASKITGEVIMQVVQDYPAIDFLVLCGHTHSSAFWNPCPNLMVKAGAAEYRHPHIQEIFDF